MVYKAVQGVFSKLIVQNHSGFFRFWSLSWGRQKRCSPHQDQHWQKKFASISLIWTLAQKVLYFSTRNPESVRPPFRKSGNLAWQFCRRFKLVWRLYHGPRQPFEASVRQQFSKSHFKSTRRGSSPFGAVSTCCWITPAVPCSRLSM